MFGAFLSFLLVFLEDGGNVVLLNLCRDPQASHAYLVGERTLILELLGSEVVVGMHPPQIE